MYLKKVVFGCIAGLSSLVCFAQTGFNRIVIVSGSGEAKANIAYVQNNNTASTNRFYSIINCDGEGYDVSAYQIRKNGSGWNIVDSTGAILYTAASDSLRPPKTGWQVVNGSAPAPSLEGYVSTELITWNGSSWSNGVPNNLKSARINSSISPGSFTAKDLILDGVTLNIGNGDTVDISGNISAQVSAGISGSLNGFALSGNSSNWVSGAGSTFNGSGTPANGLNFDGSDDYISVGNNNGVFDFSNGLTVEAWINADALSNTASTVSKFANGEREFSLLLLSSGVMEYSISLDGSAEQFFSGSTNLSAGTWYHIALTYDGSTMRAFVNGTADGTNSIAGTVYSGASELYIGARSEGSISRYFDGSIDEVRIWNVARSQSELQNHMNSELSGNETGLVSYYRFNQGTAAGNNAGVNSVSNAVGQSSSSSNKITGAGTLVFSGESQSVTNVSIDFEGVVQLNSGTTLQTNDSLTLTASSATSYGQLIGAGTVLGNVSAQAWLDVSTARYYYLGSPFTNATLEEFNQGQTMVAANSSQGTIWQWNAANAAWEAPSALTDVAANGRGYAIYAGTNASGTFLINGSGVTELDGTVVSGDISVSLGYNDGQNASVGFVGGTSQSATEGWNYLANPYPSQYDWSGQSLPAGMSNAFYVNKGGSYASYVSGVGTNGGTQYLAPFQGLWIQTSSSSPGSFTFDQDQRVTAPSTGLMKTSAVDGVWLTVLDSSSADGLFIGFDHQATPGFDPKLDARKLLNRSPSPNFYVALGQDAYSICRVPHTATWSFPLKLDYSQDGDAMTIQADVSRLQSFGQVILEDRKLNINHDLTTGDYHFIQDNSFGPDRFILKFAQSTIGTDEPVEEAPIYGYTNDEGLHLELGILRDASVEVYNLAGQLMHRLEGQNGLVSFPVKGHGLYILKVEADNFRQSVKVIR